MFFFGQSVCGRGNKISSDPQQHFYYFHKHRNYSYFLRSFELVSRDDDIFGDCVVASQPIATL